MVMLHKHHFLKNWIIKVDALNQHKPGESRSKLDFFYKFDGSHTYCPFLVKMKSLVKYFFSVFTL